MQTTIALFRGINVGGNTTLPMKELAAILQDLGEQNIRTYIQSGNVVFGSEEKDLSQLSSAISSEINKRRGFAPYVLLLKLEDIEKAIANNPFPETENDPKALHLGFLSTMPEKPDLESLKNFQTDRERFRLINQVFYLHAPDGVGRSKLAAKAEKLLGVVMTDRNWRTVCKIREMAAE